MLVFFVQMNPLVLGAFFGLLLAVSASSDWISAGGPTVRGMTCAQVLEAKEDASDGIQAAARVLGGRKTGPVLA
jgi:hypothetical protein